MLGPGDSPLRTLVLPFAALLSGCWNLEAPELPGGVVDFDPEAGAPEGWVVSTIEVPIQCPDGVDTRFYVVYPDEIPAEPMPAVILFHSGTFDYQTEATAEDPLAGRAFQKDGTRLASSWAFRQAFATLGMFPDQDDTERHEGMLISAFAEQGVVTVLPANCWGDWWHNRSGLAPNDFAVDFFERNGRTAAEWALQAAIDPAFASEQRIDLPVTIDPTRVYGMGLGEGARAVSELLAVDVDGTPGPDHDGDFAGIALDSATDDLRAYYNNPAQYANVITGLDRLFPGGAATTEKGSLYSYTSIPLLPPTVVYVYSTVDTRIPNGAHDAALTRLELGQKIVKEGILPRHVLTNAYDIAFTREVVGDLLGVPPFQDAAQ